MPAPPKAMQELLLAASLPAFASFASHDALLFSRRPLALRGSSHTRFPVSGEINGGSYDPFLPCDTLSSPVNIPEKNHAFQCAAYYGLSSF